MSHPPPDHEREGIRARLLKVLRLAQAGVGGERENAEVLLAKLLRRHSMTMADLEDASDRPRVRQWLPAGDLEERTVLSQLVIKLFGMERATWGHPSAADLGVDLTPSEHAALVIAWEVYRAAFADARQALVLGFCFRHGLYAATGAGSEPMTEEARARAAHALRLAETLPVVDPPGGRLGSGE